jgi:N-acetyl-alpha-D-glucosaminyl L-malate synthase BshA
MKIGIVCYPTFGGSGVIATELGKALAELGHQVHFITYSQPARLDFFSENLFYHEVTVSKYPLFDYPPYELALSSKLVEVITYEKLDILHVHYAIPHASAAYMAKQILASQGIHIPVITTLHGTDITLVGKDSTYKPVVTFSINQSDGVTAVSDQLRQDTYQHFNITKEIQVIHNFVDLRRFNLKPKDHFKKAIAPNGEKIIVHTSNFRKIKRIPDVIRTFSKILTQIPARLLLIGDGPERSSAEALCRELNIVNEVRFLGKQEAVEEILSISDLFLMPSEVESFGLSALEAMACHVPTIASNAGGIPEIVQEGVTGFMSPVGDIDSMAKNAIYILENEERLNQFKHAAYVRAKEFDISRIVPLYESFYHYIIDKNSVSA